MESREVKNTERKAWLANFLAKAFSLLRCISSGVLALFLLNGLSSIIFTSLGAWGFVVAAPFAVLISVATFSLYVRGLTKRINNLLKSKTLYKFITGNKPHYPKIEKLKKAFPLNKKQKFWNIVIFACSVLASLIESGTIFYSSFKVFSELTTLALNPIIASKLLPLICCIAAICSIGALIASYGVTAVAIRKCFRFVPAKIKNLMSIKRAEFKIKYLIEKNRTIDNISNKETTEKNNNIKPPKSNLNEFSHCHRDAVYLKYKSEQRDKMKFVNKQKVNEKELNIEEFLKSDYDRSLLFSNTIIIKEAQVEEDNQVNTEEIRKYLEPIEYITSNKEIPFRIAVKEPAEQTRKR